MFPSPATVRWSSSAALTGAPAAGKRVCETPGRERRARAARGPSRAAEVRLELAGLEQQPGAEAPHVAVRDVRSVV